MKVETIDGIVHIYHDAYTGHTPNRRIACRGILTDGDRILLSHEVKQGKYVLPGGGIEDGETLSQCCEREVMEETGYVVKATEQIIEVWEYDADTIHESHIYACEIKNRGERHLTEHEIYINMTPEWISVDEALAIFKERSQELGMYLREYTAIKKFSGK